MIIKFNYFIKKFTILEKENNKKQELRDYSRAPKRVLPPRMVVRSKNRIIHL